MKCVKMSIARLPARIEVDRITLVQRRFLVVEVGPTRALRHVDELYALMAHVVDGLGGYIELKTLQRAFLKHGRRGSAHVPHNT